MKQDLDHVDSRTWQVIKCHSIRVTVKALTIHSLEPTFGNSGQDRQFLPA
jgi:hypothetical protein